MNETIEYLGIGCMAFAFLFALAGAGWWRVSVSLLSSVVLAALVTTGAGLVMLQVLELLFSPNSGGAGHMDGLAAFGLAFLALYAVFFVAFAVSMLVFILKMRRGFFRRGRFSWVLLGIGALFFAGGAGAFTLNTPRHASNIQLLRHLEKSWEDPEDEAEIARRGTAMVPEIHSELLRLSKETSPLHDISPLLKMLGRIGGGEANAELHRWTDEKVQPEIRVAAVCALAKQGDRSAAPMIAQLLRPGGLRVGNYDYTWLQPDLLKALGEIKAADQVGMIRDVLVGRQEYAQIHTLDAGIGALAAIGTNEAWAAIAELCADAKPIRRSEVLTALHKIPGPRTVALAAKALDDPEARVREAAYWTIQAVEPMLCAGLPSGWSEDSGKKLREKLKNR